MDDLDSFIKTTKALLRHLLNLRIEFVSYIEKQGLFIEEICW